MWFITFKKITDYLQNIKNSQGEIKIKKFLKLKKDYSDNILSNSKFVFTISFFLLDIY